MLEVRSLSSAEAHEHLSALAHVLADCVAGGASVSFLAPFSLAEATAFYEQVISAVAAGERILLAAFAQDQLVGTVQIVTALPPNQPHRAEIAKLLVDRTARGRGVGRLLMEYAEGQARAAGKSLLVLDTVTGSTAERLYERLGWTKAGVIPRYAMFPDGRWCDTTIFWKAIA